MYTAMSPLFTNIPAWMSMLVPMSGIMILLYLNCTTLKLKTSISKLLTWHPIGHGMTGPKSTALNSPFMVGEDQTTKHQWLMQFKRLQWRVTTMTLASKAQTYQGLSHNHFEHWFIFQISCSDEQLSSYCKLYLHFGGKWKRHLHWWQWRTFDLLLLPIQRILPSGCGQWRNGPILWIQWSPSRLLIGQHSSHVDHQHHGHGLNQQKIAGKINHVMSSILFLPRDIACQLKLLYVSKQQSICIGLRINTTFPQQTAKKSFCYQESNQSIAMKRPEGSDLVKVHSISLLPNLKLRFNHFT